MLKPQDTFEPTEEEFDMPSKAKEKGNEFCGEVYEIGNEEEDIIGV